MALTADQFRRIALSQQGAAESAHMGHPDFRANGRIFATLPQPEGSDRGVLMLTPDEQEMLVSAAPAIFQPVPGGWGRNGSTYLIFAKAKVADAQSGLAMAWKIAMAKKPVKPRKPK